MAFTTLGDLVNSAEDAAVDAALSAYIQPVAAQAQQVAEIDLSHMDVWNATEEAFALAEGDEDAAFEILEAEGVIGQVEAMGLDYIRKYGPPALVLRDDLTTASLDAILSNPDEARVLRASALEGAKRYWLDSPALTFGGRPLTARAEQPEFPLF